ncbi:hypothetical protein VaNZ11_011292 [Volvox africanus]|uniref:Integrase catalytic domain-containing protein n=1 Tax=Volvox africanus TaxID=51714 RepID=A0ABQ5SB19_9CHLO|nr:hypothetical protein VaNZ11_011292 [Volvox africanus]
MKDPGMQSSPMLFGRKEYAVVKQAVLTQLKKKTCSKAIDSDEDCRDQVSEMTAESDITRGQEEHEVTIASTSYANNNNDIGRSGRGGHRSRHGRGGGGGGNPRVGRGSRGQQFNDRNGGSVFKGKCFYCKEPGHTIQNCLQRQADEAARRQAGQQQAQPPVQRQVPGQYRHLIALINSFLLGLQMAPGEWVVDTGVEAHVTTSSNNLVAFTPVEAACDTIFCMPDQRLVRPSGIGMVTFSSVRYNTDLTVQQMHVVPDVHINLFSVKALQRELKLPVCAILSTDSESYIEIGGEPAIEVYSRDGMFFIRDITKNGLVPMRNVATVEVARDEAQNNQGAPASGSGVIHEPIVQGGTKWVRPFGSGVKSSVVSALERGAWEKVRTEMTRAEIGVASVARKSCEVDPRLARARVARATLLHRRMGHLGCGNLRKLVSSGMVTGAGTSELDVLAGKEEFCEPCALGMQTRQPHASTGTVTKNRLELVHMDLCGPLSVESAGGKSYFVTFYDDFTKFSSVSLVSQKSEVPKIVREALVLWEHHTGDKVQRVHTDRGTEYVNNELSNVFREFGIFHEKTAPYSLEQNGAAERLNRILLQKMRAMLIDSGFPMQIWGEALLTANFLRNLSPTVNSDLTPWERFTGSKPDLSKLRVFGSRAYVMLPQRQRSKLDPVAVQGYLVGYEPGFSAWRVWVPLDGTIHISTDVKFDESARKLSTSGDFSNTVDKTTDSKPDQSDSVTHHSFVDFPDSSNSNSNGDGGPEDENEELATDTDASPEPAPVPVRTSGRVNKVVARGHGE